MTASAPRAHTLRTIAQALRLSSATGLAVPEALHRPLPVLVVVSAYDTGHVTWHASPNCSEVGTWSGDLSNDADVSLEILAADSLKFTDTDHDVWALSDTLVCPDCRTASLDPATVAWLDENSDALDTFDALRFWEQKFSAALEDSDPSLECHEMVSVRCLLATLQMLDPRTESSVRAAVQASADRLARQLADVVADPQLLAPAVTDDAPTRWTVSVLAVESFASWARGRVGDANGVLDALSPRDDITVLPLSDYEARRLRATSILPIGLPRLLVVGCNAYLPDHAAVLDIPAAQISREALLTGIQLFLADPAAWEGRRPTDRLRQAVDAARLVDV